jgi:rod shape-determining protein MreC
MAGLLSAMENVLTRYRNTTILVAVLFAQIIGLAVQVKRPTEAGPMRLIRYWVVSAITPLERAVVSTGHGFRSLWSDYLYLRGVRSENRALKEQIDRMRIEEVRLKQDADQARRLQALLAFKEQFISQTVAAQVIGSSGSELSRVLYIDKGSADGIQSDMAVITPDGIIGKVLRVYHNSSQVLEISDQSSGVGAILEKSRLQGILKGAGSGEVSLQYVMSDEKVEPGERVLTSGGDRIFPKGLPIGTVTAATPGRDLFLSIRVQPAANLGRLEEVLVITRIVEKEPEAPESSGPVRAADILAQRLPTVQKKEEPAAATTTAASQSTAAAAKPRIESPKPAPPPQAVPQNNEGTPR